MFLFLQGNICLCFGGLKANFPFQRTDEVGRFQRIVFPKGVVGPKSFGTFQNLPAVKSLSLQNVWLTAGYGQPHMGFRNVQQKPRAPEGLINGDSWLLRFTSNKSGG